MKSHSIHPTLILLALTHLTKTVLYQGVHDNVEYSLKTCDLSAIEHVANLHSTVTLDSLLKKVRLHLFSLYLKLYKDLLLTNIYIFVLAKCVPS